MSALRRAWWGVRHVTGDVCAHCHGPQIGSAYVDRQPLCHPDYGLDCYRLVTLYRHAMPCSCRGASDHPDNDQCGKCLYRRFEHLVDAAQPWRLDFVGTSVPCLDFLAYPPGGTHPGLSQIPSPRLPDKLHEVTVVTHHGDTVAR